jgi:hypothetical protein
MQKSPKIVDQWCVAALRASLGIWGIGRVIEPKPYELNFYPSVDFFIATVDGEHSTISGLAARLPNGMVVPVGSPLIRALLAPYVEVDLADTSQLLEFAAVLAQVEGSVVPGATIWDSAKAVPVNLLDGRPLPALRTPKIRSIVDGYLEVNFTMQWGEAIWAVTVEISREHRLDKVISSELLHGYG